MVQLQDPNSTPNILSANLDSLSNLLLLDHWLVVVKVLAKTSAARLSQTISNIVPLIINGQNKKDDGSTKTCLQTSESLLLRLPSQMTSFIPVVIDLAAQAIKHDPNYAAENPDDMDMYYAGADGKEEYDNEEFGDDNATDEELYIFRYSDDDVVSWKVRRAATKLFLTLIVTGFESYKNSASRSRRFSRFNEREESVKSEVWATQLVKQTKLHVGLMSNLLKEILNKNEPTLWKEKLV
ncbi:uncharacterized protein MELLADRAFT_86663 [Melampsora larici-populina 98AG31]|uniref:Uncharacterized protein n=1 Tax=Melampsora larici-populina (strain 98AG31 / pathotype 3-4-7) TaxID=747676 RepID=F4RMK7_MELLP|nr:uncharacterized protein MELLADRAFT_86663 [Melampsora larici-populina 98AG31]EGG06450.1 hypothetical protein MELLADRAFT_86663 [Melampsora larici-populina 98AG31]